MKKQEKQKEDNGKRLEKKYDRNYSDIKDLIKNPKWKWRAKETEEKEPIMKTPIHITRSGRVVKHKYPNDPYLRREDVWAVRSRAI